MNGEHAGERQRINARKEKDGVRETFLQADLTPAKLDSLEQTRKSLERVPTRWLFPCFAVREVMSSRPSAASRPYPISCHRVAAAPTRTFRSAADLLSAAPLFGKDFGRNHYNPIATVFGGSSPIPFANFSQRHPILPIQLSCLSLLLASAAASFSVRLIPIRTPFIELLSRIRVLHVASDVVFAVPLPRLSVDDSFSLLDSLGACSESRKPIVPLSLACPSRSPGTRC